MPTFNGCTTFHVDRVKPYIDPTAFPGCPGPDRPPPTIGDNGKEEWEVHKILDSRRYYRKLQYFVSYKGWGKEDMQWRPAEEFDYDNKAVLDSRRSTHRRRRTPLKEPPGVKSCHQIRTERKISRVKSGVCQKSNARVVLYSKLDIFSLSLLYCF